MTELVDKVDIIRGAREVSRQKDQEQPHKRQKGKRHPNETDEDSVEISEEARERATGKRRRNILEYLENNGG